MVSRIASYDFSGCVVLVTGAARGQGASHAETFAQAGAHVALLDLHLGTIEGVPYDLANSGVLREKTDDFLRQDLSVTSFTADVRDRSQIADVVSKLRREHGRIDVLVNNAGVNSVDWLDDVTAQSWNAIIDTNLRGVFHCIQEVAPVMTAGSGGTIVNIASLVSVVGTSRQAVYTASKAGVVGLTRALAVELGSSNIRVNSISPSLVNSPQTRALSKMNPLPNRQTFSPYVLPGLNALGARDVTSAVMWLCSDGARWITGINLVIDAGMSLW